MMNQIIYSTSSNLPIEKKLQALFNALKDPGYDFDQIESIFSEIILFYFENY